MTEEKNSTKSKNSPKINIGTIVTVLVIGALAVGGIYWFVTNDSSLSNNDSADLLGTEVPALSDLPDIVAEVNGVAITKNTLEENIAQTEAFYKQQGADLTDPAIAEEVFTQTLNSLINNEVLVQAVAAADISIDNATVEAELASIRAQFPDEAAFAAELETAEITIDELRDDVINQLTLNKFIANSEEFAAIPAVTEAEARELYDQSVSQAGEGQEVPSFEEVRTQIEAQITQQNQQIAIANLVAALREVADVEVMF